jgi:hypothetical protein
MLPGFKVWDESIEIDLQRNLIKTPCLQSKEVNWIEVNQIFTKETLIFVSISITVIHSVLFSIQLHGGSNYQFCLCKWYWKKVLSRTEEMETDQTFNESLARLGRSGFQLLRGRNFLHWFWQWKFSIENQRLWRTLHSLQRASPSANVSRLLKNLEFFFHFLRIWKHWLMIMSRFIVSFSQNSKFNICQTYLGLKF